MMIISFPIKHMFCVPKRSVSVRRFFYAHKSYVFIDSVYNILKAKSNFTLWTIEYIFTAFEVNQIKYCNELLVPALS